MNEILKINVEYFEFKLQNILNLNYGEYNGFLSKIMNGVSGFFLENYI